MGAGTYCTVLLLLRLPGLQCSFSITNREAAPLSSTARSTGRIPTPVGVGILQAQFNFIEPYVLCIFYRGEVHPVWSCRSRTLLSTFQAVALLLAITSDCFGGGRSDLTPIRIPHFGQSVPFSFLQTQSGESNSSGPTTVEHQGRRRSVRWTECVRSPLGQGCARQASFLTRHTQRPRHKKVSVDK